MRFSLHHAGVAKVTPSENGGLRRLFLFPALRFPRVQENSTQIRPFPAENVAINRPSADPAPLAPAPPHSNASGLLGIVLRRERAGRAVAIKAGGIIGARAEFSNEFQNRKVAFENCRER